MAHDQRSPLGRLRQRLREARGGLRYQPGSDDELEQLLDAADRALAVEDDPDS
jgi:hypothetical protein